jgi:TM2 domain-containing membrane protein YozV
MGKFYLGQPGQGLAYLTTTVAGLLLRVMGVSHVIATLVICLVAISCIIDLLRYLTLSDKAFAARYPTNTYSG